MVVTTWDVPFDSIAVAVNCCGPSPIAGAVPLTRTLSTVGVGLLGGVGEEQAAIAMATKAAKPNAMMKRLDELLTAEADHRQVHRPCQEAKNLASLFRGLTDHLKLVPLAIAVVSRQGLAVRREATLNIRDHRLQLFDVGIGLLGRR